MVYPKYLVRPDDYTIFSINEDNVTYSVMESKTEWPDRIHNKYSYQTLIKHGFIPENNDNNFEKYKQLNINYHNQFKNDRHGNGDF